MENLWLETLTFCIAGLYITGTSGACSQPATPDNSYPLTEYLSSYDTNATYDIFCKPGYTIAGESTLTCQSSGNWNFDTPSCSPSEGSYPWWLLLVLVVVVIILVPCIVPRIIFCCCCKKKERVKDAKTNQGYNNDDDDDDSFDDDDRWGPPEPMTNYGQNRKTNMDVMGMFHPDLDKKQFARANKNSNF